MNRRYAPLQEWPKSCGHVEGKRVVPRGEAIARVRAACDARCAFRLAMNARCREAAPTFVF